MRKPWSISTTVRNPERLREFLRVLKKLEGEPFSTENQIKYQELLIQERLYMPTHLPLKYQKYYNDPSEKMPFEVAKEIFELKNYKDPSMRGRQSVNPLNKLGFAIARKTEGPIVITDLGNLFLRGEYDDIGRVFFKSLLKLQFPNPWSRSFSSKDNFNIVPFIATLKLISMLNLKTDRKGLSKVEFSIFVPTLINANQINEYVDRIIKFRSIPVNERERYIQDFLKGFYGKETLSKKDVNDLFDYGDSAMRYFRLTRYFKITMDALGRHWQIDLESSRTEEIKQLLDMYNGKALKFKSIDGYIKYLSDINKPELPWENVENLKKVCISLKDSINNFIKEKNINLNPQQETLLKKDISFLTKPELETYISDIRKLNLEIKLSLQKRLLAHNIDKAKELVYILEQPWKNLRGIHPEQFEKLIAEALKILNDELLIKPNYPVDDDGEPISHAPGGKADIEYFYKRFKGICEVTLDCSNKQWVQEGQPVMRHLRSFEDQYKDDLNTFCLFIAPKIQNDTYSTFWFSVKYEYDGKAQKIIPLTTKQFASILKKLIKYLEKGEKFSHKELYNLYKLLIEETKKLQGYSQWAQTIPKVIDKWERI